jgi:hypothetical protein
MCTQLHEVDAVCESAFIRSSLGDGQRAERLQFDSHQCNNFVYCITFAWVTKMSRNWGSSVSIVTRLRAGRQEFYFRQG